MRKLLSSPALRITFLLVLLSVMSVKAAHAEAWEVNTVFGISVKGGTGETPLGSLVNQLLTILYTSAGAIAILVIVFGAIRYMGAGSDPKQVQEAKETITSAVYGLVLIMTAFLIAQLLGGDAVTNINL